MNPLFATAAKALQASAWREFRRSSLGQLIGEAERAQTAGKAAPARLGQALKQYRNFNASRAVRQLRGTEFGQLTQQVQQYAKRGGVTYRLLNRFLDELGPAGKLIRALANPKGRPAQTSQARDLGAARDFLQSFGYEVLPPALERMRGPAELQRNIGAAAEFLENLGYKVELPGDPKALVGEPKPRTRLPFGISETTTRGTQRKVVDLPEKQGRYPKDHPIVTGAFVQVQSSNVYSIAYDAEMAYLYVRFKATGQDGKKSDAPGPLYQYAEVRPQAFLSMLSSMSKGKWVWDHLRQRGTVSGHKKPYRLVGVMGGYVPRQATLTARGEEYQQREVMSTAGRWLRSSLPNQLIRPLQPVRPMGPVRAR